MSSKEPVISVRACVLGFEISDALLDVDGRARPAHAELGLEHEPQHGRAGRTTSETRALFMVVVK